MSALVKANKLTGLLSAVNGAIGCKLPTLTATGNAAELHITASYTKETVAALAPFRDGCVIRAGMQNLCITYVHDAFSGENIIMRVKQLPDNVQAEESKN